MATVKRCDRCGNYYNERGEGNILSDLLETFENVIPCSEEKSFIKSIRVIIDFCPDCERSLEKWLKEGELK